MVHGEEEVVHGAHGVGGFVDRHRDRIGLVVTDEVADVAVERRREQHGLVPVVTVPQDPLDLRGEPVVGHAVGFVERHDLHVVERHLVRLDEVDQTQRRGDDDLDTLGQLVDLVMPGGAAVDRQHPHPGMVGDRLEHFGDLHREFASGHEHEPERAGRQCGIGDPGEHRHTEGQGLARARLRAAADVLAGDGDRDRLGLDVERLGEPAGGKTFVDAGRNPEIGEPRRRFDRGQGVDGREVRGVDVAAVVRLAGRVRSRTPSTGRSSSRS